MTPDKSLIVSCAILFPALWISRSVIVNGLTGLWRKWSQPFMIWWAGWRAPPQPLETFFDEDRKTIKDLGQRVEDLERLEYVSPEQVKALGEEIKLLKLGILQDETALELKMTPIRQDLRNLQETCARNANTGAYLLKTKISHEVFQEAVRQLETRLHALENSSGPDLNVLKSRLRAEILADLAGEMQEVFDKRYQFAEKSKATNVSKTKVPTVRKISKK